MNHDDYEQLPTTSVATNMTAGAIAGVLEHCVMYPVDTVKTRMQSMSPLTHGQTISSTMMNMITKEGLMRPLRGVGAVVIGAGPAHAMYFGAYEFSKELMAKVSANNHFNYVCAGVVATVIHDAISNPTEVIKQRLQMYNSRYSSVLHCMSTVYKQEGLRAFYRSYSTQLTMSLPYQAIHFNTYEFIQNRLNKDGKYNPPVHMLAGGCAGATAAALTTPLDVVKTLLNTQETGIGQTKSMFQAIAKIHETAGLGGFFRGLLPRVLYSMPATAICWSTYEFFKYIIERRGQEAEFLGRRTDSTTTTKDVFAIVPAVSAGIVASAGPASAAANASMEAQVKARELPAMSGAGMYGALQYNTIHQPSGAATNATTMQMRSN